MMELTIGHFYPELLNLYGDRGNIVTIEKRCQWRGIGAGVKEITLQDKIDFSDIDIMVIGGGSDREQKIVGERLMVLKEDICEYVESDGVVLAICGGYQLLGKYYQMEGERIEGIGVLDIYTEQGEGRLIGNAVIETDFGVVAGFENHGGRTYINNHRPLGRVVYGHGNAGKGEEGVLYKNVFATYLHGPLLPKNPFLADEIIKRALKRKYQTDIELAPLEDREEAEARQYIIDRFTAL